MLRMGQKLWLEDWPVGAGGLLGSVEAWHAIKDNAMNLGSEDTCFGDFGEKKNSFDLYFLVDFLLRGLLGRTTAELPPLVA